MFTDDYDCNLDVFLYYIVSGKRMKYINDLNKIHLSLGLGKLGNIWEKGTQHLKYMEDLTEIFQVRPLKDINLSTNDRKSKIGMKSTNCVKFSH